MIDPVEHKALIQNMKDYHQPSTPDSDKAFVGLLEEALVGDIPPDATLQIIKAKQSEIISKQRKAFIKQRLLKRQLCDYERLIAAAEQDYKEMVSRENATRSHTDRMDKDTREARVQRLVDADVERGTLNIYDKVRALQDRVERWETIMKTNSMIADRVENMLNAQINIDKRIPMA